MPFQTQMLKVNVSVAEAFDKLSVLNVKKKYLPSEKVHFVEREIEELKHALAEFLNAKPIYKYWLNLLDYVHEEMWKAVDIYHASENAESSSLDEMVNYIKNLEVIKRQNQGRFRIKKKIDELAQSALREQKSHTLREVYILGHVRVGDQLTYLGIYRYYSIYYDKVHVYACKEGIDLLTTLLADDIFTFELHVAETTEHVKVPPDALHVVKMGHWEANFARKIRRFYEAFWEQAKVPWNLRWQLSELNLENCQFIESPPQHSYIFVHDRNQDGKGKLNPPTKLNIIRPSNLHSLLSYANVLRNAAEVHVVDSAFFCLCQYLDMSGVKQLHVYPKVWSSTYPYDIIGYCNPKQSWRLHQ